MNSATKIRVGIVDDEPLACLEMKRLLRFFDDVEVQFDVRNAEDAISKVRSMKPDLIFLDIGLPEISGLNVADLLSEDSCKIIFCTADAGHALEAFSMDVVDYLHKPVEVKRLAQSLDKYRKLIDNAGFLQESKTFDMGKPILLNDGDKVQLFTPSQIETVMSVGNHVKLRGEDLDIMTQQTLHYLESRLAEDVFFRVSRSTLVNLHKVKKVEKAIEGHFTLVMFSGEKVVVSRRQSSLMKSIFKL